MQVKTKKPIEVEVDKIVFDETNPNRMERAQIESLKLSLQKYGNIHPVILDSEQKIADGYHRVVAYRELGLKKIPAVVMQFDNDDERRLLRQVMNKLHGKHDPELDVAELERLMTYDKKQLDELLQIDYKYLEELIRVDREEKAIIGTLTANKVQYGDVGGMTDVKRSADDAGTMDYHQDSFLKGNIKQIMVYFSNEEYVEIIPRIQAALKHLGFDNNTSLFMYLLEFWEKNGMARDRVESRKNREKELKA